MRKSAVTVFILFFVVSATAFSATLQVEDRTASPDSPAHFVLEAENQQATQQDFRITSLSSPPATTGWFSYDNQGTAEAGENASLDIKVYPKEYSVQQNYRFTVNVESSDTGESQKVQEYFSVNTVNDLNIFSADISNTSYKPGQEVEANIVIVNTAAAPVTDYKVYASTLQQRKSMAGEIIPSGSKRSYTFRFPIPKNTEPGQKQVEMVLEGESNMTATRSLEVEEISSLETDTERTDNAFSNSKTVSAQNTGNTAANATLNHTIDSYLSPLTSFSREVEKVETIDGQKVYSWTETIQPGEEISIQRNTAYWPPLVLAVFLVAVFAGIERLYKGIKAEKTVKLVEDGIKVRIQILNRSRTDFRRVQIEDFVPDIASVDRDFEMAAPKLSKTGEGTRLTWDVGTLNPGEQRVMEYVIEPSVKVDGGVILPPAEIKLDDESFTKTGECTAEFDPENHQV